MSRIRSVHPGLFTDESFMSASPLARLLMIGIWCECWDDGVFEWKPLTIKVRLFPADNADVVALLSELEGLNVIKRFEHNGRSYGAVRNFCRYQRPRKPNQSGVRPAELLNYVGQNAAPVDTDDAPESESAEPVRNQSRTSPEKPKQMEDGEEKKKEPPSLRDVAPKPKTATAGSFLPKDWRPSPEGWAFGVQVLGSEAESRRQHPMFLDHFTAKTGADARKRDWDAAWRNWCRKAAEFAKQGRGPPRQAKTQNGFAALSAEMHGFDHDARPDDHHGNPPAGAHDAGPAPGDQDGPEWGRARPAWPPAGRA